MTTPALPPPPPTGQPIDRWLYQLWRRVLGYESITDVTTATYTVLDTDQNLRVNYAGTVTLTLPALSPQTVALALAGRPLRVRTITANTVVSASSNVVPLAGGAAGTAILAATAGKWARLYADGANATPNWNIVESN